MIETKSQRLLKRTGGRNSKSGKAVQIINGKKVTLTLSLHFHQFEHELVHPFTVDATLI